MALSDDELEHLKRWTLLMNGRGHAGFFARETPEERRTIEGSVADEWAYAMGREFGTLISNVKTNPDDPPDCVGILNGREIGIETTELVDGDLIAKIKAEHKHGNEISADHGPQFLASQWTEDRFSSEISKRLISKGGKYENRDLQIDVLLIYSDEKWLSPAQIEMWLPNIEFELKNSIKSAFLMLTYSPGYREHWPVFKLAGHLE